MAAFRRREGEGDGRKMGRCFSSFLFPNKTHTTHTTRLEMRLFHVSKGGRGPICHGNSSGS